MLEFVPIFLFFSAAMFFFLFSLYLWIIYPFFLEVFNKKTTKKTTNSFYNCTADQLRSVETLVLFMQPPL